MPGVTPGREKELVMVAIISGAPHPVTMVSGAVQDLASAPDVPDVDAPVVSAGQEVILLVGVEVEAA